MKEEKQISVQKMVWETEIKFIVKDAEKMRERIELVGGVFQSKVLEKNYCFDNENKEIQKNDSLLRIRLADKTILTFKSKKVNDKKISSREEIELEIDDFEKIKMILERLGFFVDKIYEKERETFKFKSLLVVLDRVPFIGYWLEIEGKEKEIKEIVPKLGLKLEEGTNFIYHQLAEEYFNKGINLTFENEAKTKC